MASLLGGPRWTATRGNISGPNIKGRTLYKVRTSLGIHYLTFYRTFVSRDENVSVMVKSGCGKVMSSRSRVWITY